MDFEGIMLREMSDGERQILHDFTHTWKLKISNNKLIQRTAYCLSEEGLGGRVDRGGPLDGERPFWSTYRC